VYWTGFVVLIVLWVFGFVSGHLFDGLLHILLGLALLALLMHIVSGRRTI